MPKPQKNKTKHKQIKQFAKNNKKTKQKHKQNKQFTKNNKQFTKKFGGKPRVNIFQSNNLRKNRGTFKMRLYS